MLMILYLVLITNLFVWNLQSACMMNSKWVWWENWIYSLGCKLSKLEMIFCQPKQVLQGSTKEICDGIIQGSWHIYEDINNVWYEWKR